jgi:hypothetical protein
MQEIATFKELMSNVDKLEHGYVYFSGDIDNLLEASFLNITDEDEDDMENVDVSGSLVPIEAHRRGMKSLLETATLQDIVDLRAKALGSPTLAQYADAVRHYYAQDDFLD